MNRKILTENYDDIIKLYQDGMSSTKISKKYNVSEHCITRILKNIG